MGNAEMRLGWRVCALCVLERCPLRFLKHDSLLMLYQFFCDRLGA
jgi:hypothetical protein